MNAITIARLGCLAFALIVDMTLPGHNCVDVVIIALIANAVFSRPNASPSAS